MMMLFRDAVLTKKVWERTQKNKLFLNRFELILKQNMKKVVGKPLPRVPSPLHPWCYCRIISGHKHDWTKRFLFLTDTFRLSCFMIVRFLGLTR